MCNLTATRRKKSMHKISLIELYTQIHCLKLYIHYFGILKLFSENPLLKFRNSSYCNWFSFANAISCWCNEKLMMMMLLQLNFECIRSLNYTSFTCDAELIQDSFVQHIEWLQPNNCGQKKWATQLVFWLQITRFWLYISITHTFLSYTSTYTKDVKSESVFFFL